MNAPVPYTPDALRRIREAARSRYTMAECAAALGWEVPQLDTICRKHGIEFSPLAIADDATATKDDASLAQEYEPSRLRSGEPRNAWLTISLTERLSGLVRQEAKRRGVPISRVCADIIARSAETGFRR